ncbi:DUF6703 family protein [Kribbia dieselivorans]|uniref:DUF6703 family protein n=1 Tax=Kribbia dieselivorans TaxID=331526 RepID=UPI000837E436|nr:DUF6703 family protein [Kribbia dieselivorans]
MSNAQRPVTHLPDLPDTAFHRASQPFMRAFREHATLTLVMVGALLVASFFLGTYGWIPLLLVTLFMLWMALYSWTMLTNIERLMRIAVLVLFVSVTLVRAFPK